MVAKLNPEFRPPRSSAKAAPKAALVYPLRKAGVALNAEEPADWAFVEKKKKKKAKPGTRRRLDATAKATLGQMEREASLGMLPH